MLYSDISITKFPSSVRRLLVSFVRKVNANRSTDNFKQAIEKFYKTLEENEVDSEMIYQIEQELGF